MSTENENFICLHITKTAGGTLKRAIKSSPSLKSEFVYGKADKQRLETIDLSNIDIVYGHMPFGLHKDLGLGPNNTKYVCFMRHPLSRTISHYHHLRNIDQSRVGDRIRESKDINDFFENYEHWEFNNFMTGSISGMGKKTIGNETEAFKLAKENLNEYFEFVGFQEFFAFSMRKLSFVLNTPLEIEKDVNVGRYNLSQVTESTLTKIEASTRFDLALYRYAIEKFL